MSTSKRLLEEKLDRDDEDFERGPCCIRCGEKIRASEADFYVTCDCCRHIAEKDD